MQFVMNLIIPIWMVVGLRPSDVTFLQAGRIIELDEGFSIAMFDYQRVCVYI
jgi:hypothetical protein